MEHANKVVFTPTATASASPAGFLPNCISRRTLRSFAIDGKCHTALQTAVSGMRSEIKHDKTPMH